MSKILDALKRPSNAAFAGVLAIATSAVWLLVIYGGVLSRDIDGGIFLSTSAAIREGSPLYSGVWDNKDPLFFLVMTIAGSITPALAFVLDWFWLALASYGTFLIARRVTRLSTTYLLALVVTPFILVGPTYIPGFTNTPGSALALTTLGLLVSRKATAAGIALGLLLFLKFIAFPAILICVVVLFVFPAWRRVARKALIAGGITVLAGLSLMLVAGWLSGYVEMFGRNRQYSSDVITYFGFNSSPIGHLARMSEAWGTGEWLALSASVLIAVGGLLRFKPWSKAHRSELRIVSLWLPIIVALIFTSLALTFVWPHHTQVLYLVYVLALIVFAAAISTDRNRWLTWVLVLVVTWLLSGWVTPAKMIDSWNLRKQAFSISMSAINEVPKDAALLGTVPLDDFTFARLGSNDDRGFMTAVPSRAHLACPEFHMYDFSPAEDFSSLNSCIQNVDVVLLTDNFVNFGNGGRAPFARPLLDYITNTFSCIKVDTTQVCQRKN